jgi:hypothetical protein
MPRGKYSRTYVRGSATIGVPREKSMAGEQQTTITDEAQRIHESAMFSAQTQFEYSKSWRSVDRWVGGSAAALAAVAATGGLSEVFTAQWTGLIAFAAAALGAIATSLGGWCLLGC